MALIILTDSFRRITRVSHIYRGLWTYKVGDPILFNESDRFALLYNNLKGTIVDIEEDLENEKIWFSIEIDKPLTELDVQYYDIELFKR